jgi:prevent-host-death family protein
VNISINSAKSYFLEMLDEIQKGKDYVIIKRGKPVARISPVAENQPTRAEIVGRLYQYQTQRDK